MVQKSIRSGNGSVRLSSNNNNNKLNIENVGGNNKKIKMKADLTEEEMNTFGECSPSKIIIFPTPIIPDQQ